ncbi:family 20 glycosylhydrolase [Dactylosporangium sp. NPDC051485]|uniref:family 20 glycosylhydrolase n=1 Tax=Dactylosporangium sp. NPDC051485 TaxID=3154846 RepID=UPI003419AC0F
MHRSPRTLLLASAVAIATAATGAAMLLAASPASAAVSLSDVVPAPVSAQPAAGVTYTLPSDAAIQTAAGATDVGNYLAGILRPSTGYALPVSTTTGTPTSGIALLLSGADPSVGAEGYQLDVTAAAVTLRAQTASGLFHGVQTLRQLLPATVEAKTVQSGPWTVTGGRIVDYPRYGYRGAMLDVSRHFFAPDVVKRYIDEIAQYKINTLHLHLSDDQGWRIVIDAWPRLATVGGSTQVGGGAGGYYTKAQYSDIVSYAASRQITIVPEIDMPGHTNAALASYAELNCNNTAPALYTGTNVGFSSFCVSKEVTYTFVQQVLSELAAITPGPYLHIGGDEASSTPAADYRTFINRIQPYVGNAGKTVIGWHQIGQTDHTANRVAQFWGTGTSDADLSSAVSKGDKVLLSPANKTYIDMKYTNQTTLGQTWAGLIEVQTAYNWDPGAYLSGVPASAIIGVEAPLWTETITKLADIEYMAFPRLPAIAELAWSPQAARNWDTFKVRLGAQGPRWTVQGINYYSSPQVPWGTQQTTRSAYTRIETESFTSQSGTQTETTTDTGGGQDVGYISPGDWLAYTNVDFGAASPASVTTRLASGGSSGTIQYRLDSTTGPIIASVPVTSTGGWQTWTSTTTNLSGSATGVHTVYLTFTGTAGADFVNLNWLQFNAGSTLPNAYTQIQAESFTSQSGTQTETTTDTGGGQDVGYISPGDWLAYTNVDFGTPTAASVTTRLASGASSGTIQYRLDSTTGPIIASVPVTSTGGWQTWTSTTTNLSGSATGVHTVYLTFTGTAGADFVNLNWFQFNR